jgi:hypothetical protein
MDLRLRLRVILHRVQLSARELELQPETFQATGELRLAAGDLVGILRDLDRDSTDEGRGRVRIPRGEASSRNLSNVGTVLALARHSLLAA